MPFCDSWAFAALCDGCKVAAWWYCMRVLLTLHYVYAQCLCMPLAGACLQAVLERTLRSYTCLTVGDQFVVHYNGRTYEIEVGGPSWRLAPEIGRLGASPANSYNSVPNLSY
jgi:hypothetical protein